jgi:hypothetical protein
MSAFPPITTDARTFRDFSFVPVAAMCSAAKGNLFDHLVGARQKSDGDSEAESLSGLKVDDQLDARGLLHRQIARLIAPQDTVENFFGTILFL